MIIAPANGRIFCVFRALLYIKRSEEIIEHFTEHN